VVAATPWDPDQYARFRDERSQPFYDLLHLIEAQAGMRIADLGCGPGDLTRALHVALEARETLGIDNSDTMLARAAQVPESEGLNFHKADLRGDLDLGTFDLVFSNAALQWVGDHPTLIGRLAGLVRPGGQLAVQVPSNHEHPAYALVYQMVAEPPFAEALGGYTGRLYVLAPETYARLLHEWGFRPQHVRLQVYPHYLSSRDEVVELLKGTQLTTFQARLSAELFDELVGRYQERLRDLLPDERPFFYPFKRILLWGRRLTT
jgi:trans-aconitate 2-methyltransferase